jgi:transposase-like protein
MALTPVLCPHCHSDHVINGSKTTAGQQRDKCQHTDCPRYRFQRDHLDKGRTPGSKAQIVEMRPNGSGIRDTARVLTMSPTAVINTSKKGLPLPRRTSPLLNTLHPDDGEVGIQQAGEAEVDEMWSYVGKKTAPRWLWHAID